MYSPDDMIERALSWLDQGRDVALATVIETWGSSPRSVGSQLVVDGQGSFEGSVSGGCIEGSVITEALEILSGGKPRRHRYGVSNDLAWEVGLSCGGEVEIFVETAKPHRSILDKLMALRRGQHPLCLVTDLDTGEKWLAQLDDRDCLDALPEELRAAVADVEKKEHSIRLQHRGKTFFLHALMPNPQLVIVGAVHIAGALADIARIAGYRVVIIDPRGAFATAERFPGVHLEVEWPDEVLENMPLHSRTAIVTLTHDPKLDDPALELALRSNAFYIGALGSRKTHAARLERLADAGVDRESLKRIHAPVGLDIGADNPAEIAIAIMAQITEKRRKDKQPKRAGCWEDKEAGGLTVLYHTTSSAAAPAKAR